MSMKEIKLTFREVREQHGIDLEHLFADTPIPLSTEAIERLDLYGEAEPWVVKECLESLSRLIGRKIAEGEIGGIHYIMSKNGRATPSAHTAEPLPEKPTMQQLRDYYLLDTRSVVDLAQVEVTSYAGMLARWPVKRSEVMKVLRVISDFAGVEYTLENVEVTIAPPSARRRRGARARKPVR